MADPNLPPLPPGFTLDAPQAPAFGNRPVIQENAPPPSAPSGYRFTTGGGLEPIPGGPADPNKDAPKIGASAVSGPEYLKTLDAGTANMVKALADGRKAFPAGAALRAPYWQEMLAHVSNYDPGFDEVNYTARSATRRDFTSGKAANNIRALNTAIGHLGHLAEQVDGTASHDLTPLNAIENTALRLTGNPGPTNFDATVSALAGELTAVYRGSGGAEADIQRYVQQLSPNASEAQKVGTIRNIVGLLKSRLDALNDQYRQGMGTTAQQLQLLDPQAQLIVHHLGGFDASGAPQDNPGGAAPPGMGGGSPPSPPPAGPQDQLAPAAGQTKDVVDPSLTPVRREYLGRLQAGQSGAQLVAFLRGAGVNDPALLQSAEQQAAFRRKNPNAPVSQYDTAAIDHLTQQMGAVNRAVNAVGQTDLGAGIAAAGNAAIGNLGPELIGATGGNATQARAAFDMSAQDHPGASLAGSIIGGTAAALGGEAALARGAGMAPGFARSLVANSLYGGVAGAGASPDNRLGGAAMGAAAGAGGSLLGEGAARVGSKVLGGLAGADATALLNSDTPLTIGQAVGGKLKSLEDKAMSYVPGIAARRAEGVQAFNARALDKALEPIGAKGNGQAGSEGIDHALTAVKGAFDSALKGKVAVPDAPFLTESRAALGRLATIRRNDLGSEIVGQIEEATKDLFDPATGELSGENMQTFLESMRQVRQAYKSDPLSQRVITPSIKQIENAVEGMFERQAPDVVPAFNSAKAAYRRVSVLADAVNSAENTNGIYTPAQLGQAARANAKKYDGPMSAAANRSDLRQFQREAQNVLPSTIPNSGTADRAALAAIPAALAGGAGGYELGGHDGAATGIGIVGALSLLYSRKGQSALVSAAVKRDGVDRAIARALDKYRAVAAAGGGATSVSTTASPQEAIPYP